MRRRQYRQGRKRMVDRYMARHHVQMPRIMDVGSHWARRWQWCSQFAYFMGVKEIELPPR